MSSLEYLVSLRKPLPFACTAFAWLTNASPPWAWMLRRMMALASSWLSARAIEALPKTIIKEAAMSRLMVRPLGKRTSGFRQLRDDVEISTVVRGESDFLPSQYR